MTADDKLNLQSNQVMEIYNEKYGKKTFFEEMWEKDHPEEAQKLVQEEENKKKAKIEEAKKKK